MYVTSIYLHVFLYEFQWNYFFLMGLRQALKSSELLKWKKKEFPQMSGNQIIVISRTKDV